MQLAQTNPDLALNVSTQDLVQTLTIAAQLFNRRVITAQEGWLFMALVVGFLKSSRQDILSAKTQLVSTVLNHPTCSVTKKTFLSNSKITVTVICLQ